MMKKHGRFLLAAFLLILTTVFLHGRSNMEVIPNSKPLAQFPMTIGDWNAKVLDISDDERSVLGAGDFMARRWYEPAHMWPRWICSSRILPRSGRGKPCIRPRTACLVRVGCRSSPRTVGLKHPGVAPFP